MAAKDETLWAVNSNRYWYKLYRGRKPVRSKTGSWPRKRRHEWVCAVPFEWLIPKRLWPKPGGPAVKVEFN